MCMKSSLGLVVLLGVLGFVPAGFSQDRERDSDHRDRNHDQVTRIEPGTNIAVRPNQAIDVEHFDNRVYYGTVDQDVRGENGRVGIPRGSRVELIVRVMRDNDLVLDLESVMVNGQRYAVQTERSRVESRQDNSLVGSIIGAINGGQYEGRAVRIPAGTVLNFRVQAPLVLGVADRGVDRDGNHYHDWYKRDDYYRRDQ